MLDEEKQLELKKQIDKINRDVYAQRNSSELNLSRTIKYLEGNVNSAKAIDYHEGFVESCRVLAIIYSYNGQATLAEQVLIDAEKIYEKYSLDEEILAGLYAAYVFCYLETKKDYKAAARYCNLGLRISKKYGLTDLTWKYMLNFAMLYLELDMYDGARKYLNETLEFGKASDNEQAQLYSYANLADLEYRAGNIVETRRLLEKAYELALKLDDIIVLSSITYLSANMEMDLGNKGKACITLENSINKLVDNEQHTWNVYLSLKLLSILITLNDFEKTEKTIARIHAIIDDLENDKFSAEFYLYKTHYYERIKNYKDSLRAHKAYHMYSKKMQEKEVEEVIDAVKEETMKQTIERLKILSDVGQKIASQNELEGIFIEVNKHVSSIFEDYNFAVAIRSGENLDCIYYSFLGRELPPFSISLDNKDAFLSLTIEKNDIIVVNDLEKEYSRYVSRILYVDESERKRPPKSLLNIPLVVLGKTIGVLQIQTYAKDAFNRHNIEFFSVIASYVAIAIRNFMQTEELKDMASTDLLTGLRNWRYFNLTLQKIIEEESFESPMSLLTIDIDYFKRINDTYGHDVGNECLKSVADIIRAQFSEKADMIARIGGEEFAVLFMAKPEARVLGKVNRLFDAFNNNPVCSKRDIFLSVSVGLGISGSGNISATKLMTLSDKALYKAKNSGRGQVVTMYH